MALIVYAFGYRRIIPVAVLFGMLPISEIAFVVIRSGVADGVLSPAVYSIILNTVIVSMLIGPLAAKLAKPFYSELRQIWPENTVSTINLPDNPMKEHAIIAGGGKFARYVALALRESGTPFILSSAAF